MLYAQEFGKAFVPERFRPRMREYFIKAGIYDIPYTLFGLLFYVSVLISGYIYTLFFSIFSKYNPLVLMLVTFVFFFVLELVMALLFMGGIYFYLDVHIFRRTKEIEAVFPDFLNVVSENIKTGMSLDKAFWGAIKPEFGVLSREIQVASKRVATGQDVTDALKDFAHKYDSPNVKRAILLIVESMAGGGEIADIIDKTVDDLRQTNVLKQRLTANAVSFVIFITIIVLVMAPGLFALAYTLLTVLGSFTAQLSNTTAANSIISFGEVAVDLDEFKLFSQLAIGTISFFSAMIVSSISKGDVRSGLKYLPLFLLISLTLYTVFRSVLVGVFGSIF